MKRTSAAEVALLVPLVRDAPIMRYVAWRIGAGAAPYRDLFDMNVPGVYLLPYPHVLHVGTRRPGP